MTVTDCKMQVKIQALVHLDGNDKKMTIEADIQCMYVSTLSHLAG